MGESGARGFRSLTSRLVIWILGCGGLVYVRTLAYSNWLTGRMVRAAAERETVRAAQAAVARIDEVLDDAEDGTRGLAALLEATEVPETELGRQLELLVLGKRNVYGAAAAFEPYGFSPKRERFAPYRHRQPERRGGPPAAADLAAPSYRHWEKDWYTAVRDSGEARWSEPYLDEGGGRTQIVGDVSGKGIPAALFMARTKTLFEIAAARHDDPGEILAEANRALSAENDGGM